MNGAEEGAGWLDLAAQWGHHFILSLNNFVVDLCLLLAIVVILIGVLKALWIFMKDALMGAKASDAIEESRMELGHCFSLGLGFLIGASILKTTIAPNWNDIGQLAAIIAIRTILNYFLLKEIKVQKAEKVKRDSERYFRRADGGGDSMA